MLPTGTILILIRASVSRRVTWYVQLIVSRARWLNEIPSAEEEPHPKCHVLALKLGCVHIHWPRANYAEPGA